MGNYAKLIPLIQQLRSAALAFCQVWSWMVGHSEMYILVGLSSKPTYLFFPSVAYFAGPKDWDGADFHLATPAECLKRARELHLFNELDDDTISDTFRLYTLTKPTLHVEIIAGEMELIDQLPEHLR